VASSPELPLVDPAAFDFPGAGPAAALCLHGLTGTPYEVCSLGRAFAEAGIRALGPALPGHNETPERLAKVRHTDWIEAARAHLRALRGRHEKVFVVGLSMGGLVSLELAATEKPDAVVAVGTPLRFGALVRWAVPVAKYLKPMMDKSRGSDIRDPAARARHPSYTVMPLHAVHELTRLQRRVRAKLGAITGPILVAHGAHDRTANPADAHRIHAEVASEIRELLILEDSGHVVPVDRDADRLAAAATDFLRRFAAR